MRINNNIMAMNTYRQLGIGTANGAKSMEKLSSGLRINRAGDDAAGLAISEKMRGQIRGLTTASRNAQDSISLIQTAEGALTETHAILQRMRELAVQSANDTNVDVDRSEIQKEINQLTEEITRIAETTEFNTQNLLDGTLKSTFQIGANQNQSMKLSINDMSAKALDVLSDTITIGSKGSAVKGVDADLGFKIEDYSLTATKGGAVAAELTATEVDTDGYIKDMKMSYSRGITQGGSGIDFVDNEIEIDKTYSEFNWGSIDAGKANSIVVEKTTAGLKVSITGNDSDGNSIASVDEYATLNEATGNYEYNNHGVSFSISKAEYDTLSDGTDKVTLDLSAKYGGSGTVDVGGAHGTASTYSVTGLSDAADRYPTFSDITFDADNLVEGAHSISVVGENMTTGHAGEFTVVIKNSAGGVLVNDKFTFAAGQLGNEFSYDNHGVSFTISDLTNATTDGLTGISFTGSTNGGTAIEKVSNSVNITSGSQALELKITDQDGVKKTLNVSLAAGEQDIQDVVDAINAAATDAGFTSDIASIVDDNIKLVSLNTGDNAVIEVGGSAASAIFSDTEATGSDASVALTLEHKTDSTKNISAGNINPSATSVKFTDGDGNKATFALKGYANVNGVDVAKEFAASNIKREVSGIDVSSHEAASQAVTAINNAIEKVSSERSMLGATQNRLEHTIKNLDTSAENLQAAESRIRDVDMAKEMMEFTKNNILQQAATAMLAQANQAPQGVLQLLR